MTDELDVGSVTDEQLAAMISEEAPAEEAPEQPELEAPVAEETPEAPKPEAKHVPLAELLEERGRRKEAQARMEEMERRFSEIQARTAEYIRQQQAQPVQPEVKYEDDPIEYLRQQQAAVAQNLEAMRQQQEALLHRQQAERQWAQMREAVSQHEAQFAQRQPDYWDAVKHLREHRASQLAAQGLAEQQIAAAIQSDAIAVANEAGRLGLSPAEYAYRIALGVGYTPKQQQAAKAAVAAQDAPKSLGGTSGRGDSSSPSLSDISKMSDKEFDKVFAKLMTGT